MTNLFQKVLVGGVFVALQLAMPVKNLHAGPFLDWLLGRPILTYPSQPTVAATAVPVLAPTSSVTTAAYPTTPTYPLTANYATTANAACPCQVTAGYAAAPTPAATTTYLPVVAQAAQPVQYFNPTVVGHAPAYRSSWYRVPLTYYRPVTAYTGVGAQPVTVMQPCNTQTWQVQRSPLLFHRPWLPATTTVPYAAYAPVVTQPTFPAVAAPVVTAQPNCPCPNAASVAPTLSTTPHYSPSTTTMPLTTMPSTTTPSTEIPSTHIPSDSDPVPESPSMPADQAPALQQFDQVPGNYPNSAAFTSPGTTSTASTPLVVPNTAGSVYQVKPIPDSNVNHATTPARVVAPPLLNPRERSASQTTANSASVTRAVYKPTVPSTPAATQRRQAPAKQQLWNDSGWHTAGR